MSEAEFTAMSASDKALRVHEHYGEALAVVEAGESGAVEVAISDGERSSRARSARAASLVVSMPPSPVARVLTGWNEKLAKLE